MVSDTLSILIIDDHDLVRAGVSAAVSELTVNTKIFSAASITEGLAILGKHPDIDLVLLDLVLPDVIHFSGLEAILSLNPEVPVILLTADARPQMMDEAFRLGAAGYIPKSSNMQIIVNALRIILAGGRYLPGEMLDREPGLLFASGRERNVPNQKLEGSGNLVYCLTERQQTVAELLRRGMSNKEICRELDLGVSTVKTHVASILRALRTTSRAKAMALLNSGQK